MHCIHCGYVSFDYLSACPRCGKSLPAIPRYAVASPVPSSQAEPSAVPSLSPSGVAVQEDIEEEVDWSRLSLPAEVRAASRPVLVYAGFFRRAIALLIDVPFLLLLTVLAMALASLAAVGGGTVAGDVTREVVLLASGAALAMILVVSLAYHAVCWGQGGQTPGKMLMRVKVVRWDGEEIGYGRAVLRWIGYFLALLPLGLGFLWVLFDSRRRGLHDILAGTCVIRVDR